MSREYKTELMAQGGQTQGRQNLRKDLTAASLFITGCTKSNSDFCEIVPILSGIHTTASIRTDVFQGANVCDFSFISPIFQFYNERMTMKHPGKCSQKH